MKIKVTDADYVAALQRDRLDAPEYWKRLRQKARQAAAERLLKVNAAEQRRLIEEGDRLTGIGGMEARVAYLKNADQLTKVFAEHDELLDIAYPGSKARKAAAE